MNARVSICAMLGVVALAARVIAADDDWARVSRLERGTAVIVSVDRIAPVHGSVNSVDAGGLEIALDGPSPARIVKRLERVSILEIRTPESTSNPIRCAFAGYFGGAFIGGLPGALVGGAIGRDTGPALVGMMVGWSLGGVHVYRRCRTHPEHIIYTAP